MAGYSNPGWNNNSAPAISKTNLDNQSFALELAQHPYGVCSSAASTVAKTVTIDFSGTLTLYTGLRITVYFSNANTAVSPTLNVNGTGATLIKRFGTGTNAGTTAATSWAAGAVIDFVYNGTYWIMQGGGRPGASMSSVTLAAGSWSGTGPYTQTVSPAGATVYSKVDLQPDAATISQMISDGVAALFVQNNNGTFTAYAVGAKPTANLTIQATLTEVF